MKIVLTAGEDAEGKVHLLYLGRDAEHAIKALENPPPGILRTAMFRKPGWDKRRQFPDNAALPPEKSVSENSQIVPPSDPVVSQNGQVVSQIVSEAEGEIDDGAVSDSPAKQQENDLPPTEAFFHAEQNLPVEAPATEPIESTGETPALKTEEKRKRGKSVKRGS